MKFKLTKYFDFLNINRSAWYIQALWLSGLLIAYGLYSVYKGQSMVWDFLNYHLYNGYALIEGRWNLDLMPAGVHTFLNPVLDALFYFFIKYLNEYPRVISFIWTLPSGILMFFFYKFCLLIFPKKQYLLALFPAILAGGGYIFRGQIGAFGNDVFINMLAMIALYNMFRFLFVPGSNKRFILLGVGCIIGIAAGLKYTMLPVALALFAVLCVNIRFIASPFVCLSLFSAGCAGGFLVVNGYFMWHLWCVYQNPVFPYYNQFFKSPFWVLEGMTDLRFYPHTLLQWLFFPFLRFMEHQGIISEFLRDIRGMGGYISFFIIAVCQLFKRIKKPVAFFSRQNRKVFSLLIFVFVSYVIWLPVFGIWRYVIILEMLSCLLMIYALSLLPIKKIFVVFLALGLLGAFPRYTSKEEWTERLLPFQQHFVEFIPQVPSVEKNSMVVLFGTTMSFLAPFFPEDTIFVGGIKFPDYEDELSIFQFEGKMQNFLPEVYYRHLMDEKIKSAILAHEGPVYMLSVPWGLMFSSQTLNPYGLKWEQGGCQEFNVNINTSLFHDKGWMLCKLEKIQRKYSSRHRKRKRENTSGQRISQ